MYTYHPSMVKAPVAAISLTVTYLKRYFVLKDGLSHRLNNSFHFSFFLCPLSTEAEDMNSLLMLIPAFAGKPFSLLYY